MRSFLNIFSAETGHYAKVIKETAQNQFTAIKQSIQYQGDSIYFEVGNYLTDEQIKEKLASKEDSDTYDALKLLHVRLIQGKDILQFYPDLVLCLHKSPHESKRFAYLILSQIQHLQSDSQDALMPINMLHKEIQTKEPLRRADALKTITDMSVDEVYPWLFSLCKTACSDQNSHVRCTALLAIQKVVDMTSFDKNEYQEDICNIVQVALKDRSLDVVIQALLLGSLLIERDKFLQMLHYNIEMIVESLSVIDKHSSLLYTLIAQYATRYLQTEIHDPLLKKMIKQSKQSLGTALNCDVTLGLVNLICELSMIKIHMLSQAGEAKLEIQELIQIVKDPLRQVLSKHHFERSYALDTIAALVELVSNLKDKQTINLIEKTFASRLFFKSNEPQVLQLQKLSLIKRIYQLSQAEYLLEEICTITKSTNSQVRLNAVKALAVISLEVSEPSQNEANLIVTTLTSLLKHSDETLVNEAVISLQRLINSQDSLDNKIKQTNGRIKTKKQVVVTCAKRLSTAQNSNAKAMMIHLLTQQAQNFPTLSQETLRRLIKGFNQESDELVKCQILTLGAKVYAQSMESEVMQQIYKYLLKVASLDKSLLVRQKARLFQNVFDNSKDYILNELLQLKVDQILLQVEKQEISENQVQFWKIGTFNHDLSMIVAASPEEVQQAVQKRKNALIEAQEIQQQNSSSSNQKDAGTVQSISSEQFKGMLDSLAASAKQNYNRSHFSKKDGNELKQEYEDFFAEDASPALAIEETKQKTESQKAISDQLVSLDDF